MCSSDLSAAMGEDVQSLFDAAAILDRAIRLLLSQDGRLQAETWITAVARMAGTLLLMERVPAGSAPAGSTVLVEGIDQEGPRLVRLMLITLAELGTTLAEDEIEAPAEEAAMPQLSLAETRARLEALVMACARSHGLGLAATADALTIATALAIHHCREEIGRAHV